MGLNRAGWCDWLLLVRGVKDGHVQPADQAHLPSRKIGQGQGTEGLYLGEADRVGRLTGLARGGQGDKGSPKIAKFLGECDALLGRVRSRLGEGDQLVGEAFIKLARSPMNSSA